jgi:hypothetical protein
LLNQFLLTQDCVQLSTDRGAYVYRSPSQSRGRAPLSRSSRLHIPRPRRHQQ